MEKVCVGVVVVVGVRAVVVGTVLGVLAVGVDARLVTAENACVHVGAQVDV